MVPTQVETYMKPKEDYIHGIKASVCHNYLATSALIKKKLKLKVLFLYAWDERGGEDLYYLPSSTLYMHLDNIRERYIEGARWPLFLYLHVLSHV